MYFDVSVKRALHSNTLHPFSFSLTLHSNRSTPSNSGGSEELTPLTAMQNNSNVNAAAGNNTKWLTAENASSVVVGSEI